MNLKTYETLELDKVIGRLAAYADFSASRFLLEALEPTTDLEEAQRRQQETTEARILLEEQSGISIGGARDVREDASNAAQERRLNPVQFLHIKDTLESAIRLRRTIERSEREFTLLQEIAYGLMEGHSLIAAINRTVDDNGEVVDTASTQLARIRREIKSTQDRLRERLNTILNNPRNADLLQDHIITTRGGRYVIPIKAAAKGRFEGIVHDQSASGATMFIEPVETVSINNRLRELEIAEQDEVIRILRALSAEVGAEADDIIHTVEALANLDAAFARAKYANELNANAPSLTGFEEGGVIRLLDARHPLIDPEVVVAIDVWMDDARQLVITGPNTGGKTVSLKTVGLLVLMAQCGMHLPASPETVLSVFDQVFADIGDEQSIEQSLSTFSGHMTNIIRILRQADERSLVILDELGSGTDPAEGAAIARAILNRLADLGSLVVTATHYPELKLYAHATPGVQNASMEFDLETLAPTYRLIIGLPGRSNALAIASRLGMDGDLIEDARSYIGESDLQTDDLLDEILNTRQEIFETRERLALEEEDLQEQNRKLRARLDRIEEERQQVLTEAREQAQKELKTLRREMDDLRRQLHRLSPAQRRQTTDPLEALEEVNEEIGTLEDRARQPVVVPTRPKRRRAAGPAPGTLSAGDRVFVRSLNAEGEVLSMGDEVEVQVGALRVRVDPEEVERRGGSSRREAPEVEVGGYKAPRPESPGLELDMRGMRVEEAMHALEDYLDTAYLAGLPWARILHGKGSGALRKAVREKLHNHELIRDYKAAPRHEGGDGVTLVYFAELA